jgi:lauroyl/myristoyl acyltransferase
MSHKMTPAAAAVRPRIRRVSTISSEPAALSGSSSRPGPAAAGAPSPQAPERGWSWRLLRSFHVTGIFWYRFHGFVIRATPEPLLEAVATFFAIFFYVCLRRIGAAIAANLEAALGPCGFAERQRRIFRTIWSFGWCMNERTERLTTDRPFRIETEGIAIWNELTRGGRGIVLVTAHVGNYEVGSMMPAQVEQRQVHLVREPEPEAATQAYVQGVITRFSQEGFQQHFQADDPSLGVALYAALRRGEIVAIQGDRPRAGAEAVDTTLFGRPFALPPGPAALARAASVPMLPVFVFREGRRHYRVVFRPPIAVPRTADRRADVASAMRQVAAEIERAIRRAPDQWFCFRRLWP